jgi:hypothetical protein
MKRPNAPDSPSTSFELPPQKKAKPSPTPEEPKVEANGASEEQDGGWTKVEKKKHKKKMKAEAKLEVRHTALSPFR